MTFKKSRVDYFDREIKIHICKDGTISYRRPNELVFNGVAIHVFSVDTVEQAKALQIRFGRLQYNSHPLMERGSKWYKLTSLPDGKDLMLTRPGGLLEHTDLGDISQMFNTWWLEVGRHAS